MNKEITTSDYYKIKRVSNSLLSMYSNPRLLKMKMDNPDSEDEDKRHFRVGSALDCLLTGGDFAKEFVVADVIRPYGFMSKFAENLPPGMTIQSPLEGYVDAYRKAGYKMSMEKVVGNFWANEEAVKYYQLISSMSMDKRILSRDEAEVVYKAYELISANEFIKPYFINDDPDIEIQRQVVILFSYLGVDCKGMLDVVWINHKTKKIQLIDLKTIGKSSVWEFPQGSYIQYGYYRQAAFYTLGVFLSRIYADLLDKGYEIENKFLFVVVEVKPNSQHPCVGFRVNDVDKGRTGFTDEKGQYHVGFDQLLEAYKWHNETGKWDLPYELYKSQGIIDIK